MLFFFFLLYASVRVRSCVRYSHRNDYNCARYLQCLEAGNGGRYYGRSYNAQSWYPHCRWYSVPSKLLYTAYRRLHYVFQDTYDRTSTMYTRFLANKMTELLRLLTTNIYFPVNKFSICNRDQSTYSSLESASRKVSTFRARTSMVGS